MVVAGYRGADWDQKCTHWSQCGDFIQVCNVRDVSQYSTCESDGGAIGVWCTFPVVHAIGVITRRHTSFVDVGSHETLEAIAIRYELVHRFWGV